MAGRAVGFILAVIGIVALTTIAHQRHGNVVILVTKDGPTTTSSLSKHHASTKSSNSRGRVHDAPDSAKQLKEKAERADHEARELRKQANTKYDESHELSRQTGIMTHRISRITRKEAALQGHIDKEEQRIKDDVHKLAQAVVMKQHVKDLKEKDDKDLKLAEAADSQLAAAHVRIARDERREKAQAGNVALLLKRASQLAGEAQSSLSRSQRLRLSSESEVGAASTQEAADKFQQANSLRISSSKLTRKALDDRSKARLDQEYVAILTRMVAKDKNLVKVDNGLDQRARDRQEAVRRKWKQTQKTLNSESQAAIRQDRDVTTANRHRDRATLKEDEGKVAAYSAQAKREEHRAMHLLHESHRLQAEAARKLSLSTSDIELEEEQA